MINLQYPIGRYEPLAQVSPQQIIAWINDLEQLPDLFKAAAAKIEAKGHLEKTYRPEGWTARQVIHHVPDSHSNAYIRFKIGLTETAPTIRPYNEVEWALLPDSKAGTRGSLNLLTALHEKWVPLLRALRTSDWERTVFHPATKETITLASLLGHYSWHGRHHLGHLQLILQNS